MQTPMQLREILEVSSEAEQLCGQLSGLKKILSEIDNVALNDSMTARSITHVKRVVALLCQLNHEFHSLSMLLQNKSDLVPTTPRAEIVQAHKMTKLEEAKQKLRLAHSAFQALFGDTELLRDREQISSNSKVNRIPLGLNEALSIETAQAG